MSLDLNDEKSTLVQVMAWCRQATSQYLSQCWPRSLLLYGVTRPQWVNMHKLRSNDYSFLMAWRLYRRIFRNQVKDHGLEWIYINKCWHSQCFFFYIFLYRQMYTIINDETCTKLHHRFISTDLIIFSLSLSKIHLLIYQFCTQNYGKSVEVCKTGHHSANELIFVNEHAYLNVTRMCFPIKKAFYEAHFL